MHMHIKAINYSRHHMLEYATKGASGADLRASLVEPLKLLPGQRELVSTGLHVAIPYGFEGQVRPRSGWALRQGITVLNSPGTIDSDYRGEIRVLLINLSDEECTIHDGERIAQLVVAPYTRVKWELTDTLDETDRGEGGYGSTGTF